MGGGAALDGHRARPAESRSNAPHDACLRRLHHLGASLAKRSLLVAILVAPPLHAAARQNVLEYVHARLLEDRSLDAATRQTIEAALRDRFANYAFNVVDPDKPQDARALLHV